jgi:hypothetical protein
MQLRMLRLSLDFLGVRENCEASLCSCSAPLCALVRRALTALNVCTAARALSSTPTSTGPTSPARGGCNTNENTADGEHCDEDGLSGDTDLENDEHLAAVTSFSLIFASIEILSHTLDLFGPFIHIPPCRVIVSMIHNTSSNVK